MVAIRTYGNAEENESGPTRVGSRSPDRLVLRGVPVSGSRQWPSQRRARPRRQTSSRQPDSPRRATTAAIDLRCTRARCRLPRQLPRATAIASRSSPRRLLAVHRAPSECRSHERAQTQQMQGGHECRFRPARGRGRRTLVIVFRQGPFVGLDDSARAALASPRFPVARGTRWR